MSELLEFPKIQELNLNELKKINNSPYKSGLLIIDKEKKGIISLYTSVIKKDVDELSKKGGLKPKPVDEANFPNAFAFKRDFETRYASYQTLMKKGYDSKMFNNVLLSSRYNALKKD